MRRFVVFALLAALVVGLGPLVADAQSTLAEIKKRDKLIVGVKTDFPPFGSIDAAGKPFYPRPYGIAVRKGDVEFNNWVNTLLKKMRADGTYDRIWKKHVGEFESQLIKP